MHPSTLPSFTLPDDAVIIRRADLDAYIAARIAEATPAPDTANALLAPVDVARRLTISKSAVHNLIAAGELPALRFGRAVRVRPADVELFIEEHNHYAQP
jgi:excisionase family DNA binding protein